MANPLFQKIYQHVLDDDVVQATQDRRPSLPRDFRTAKLILSENSQDTGDSLYDHLVAIIKRTLDERPPNVVDYFEDYSRQIREQRYKISEKHLHETYIEPIRLLSAKKILALLTEITTSSTSLDDELKQSHSTNDENPEENDDEELHTPLITDIMQLKYYWSLAGIGLPQDKVFLLSCCIEKLKLLPIVRKCRFWGEMFGTTANYYIAEVDLTEMEIENRRTTEITLNPEQLSTNIIESNESVKSLELSTKQSAYPPKPIPLELMPLRPTKSDDNFQQPALPQSKYKPPHEVPAEICGIGLNRKTYFVCNQLGDEWQELPPVTSAEIVAARKLKKFFTGNLDASLNSTFPVFYGREENFLRATIARITASTFVAPIGFYRKITGDDDDDDETDSNDDESSTKNNDKDIEPDNDYQPLKIDELIKSSNWIHCRPHILSQGRVNWFNIKDMDEKKDDNSKDESDDDADDVDSENEDEESEIKQEIGPALFTPCSKDKTVELIIPWTIRWTNQIQCNKDAIVIMQSNLWPGAVSLAITGQRVHDCLYIGWGQKFVTRNYSPSSVPQMQNEWIGDDGELIEMNDPSVQEEEVFFFVLNYNFL